jgi:LysM repeat protein
MNNPNPFVPKGSLLEQQSQRRSRLKIAVFCVLAISVTGLVAMLIQGCKREAPAETPPDTNLAAMDTNSAPVTDTNLTANPPAPATPTPTPGAPGNAMPAPAAPPVSVVPPPMPPAPEVAPGATYEVVSGDTLAKIAKKNGVTLKALEEANPGVNPKRLKIKQKLNIPAATTSANSASGETAAAAGSADNGGGTSYTVKSGDTLTKIAKKNGVTLKALRAANPKIASTDHIHVGDKLTIPAKAEASAPAPAAPPAPDTSTAMPPVSAPVTTSAVPPSAAAPAPSH